MEKVVSMAEYEIVSIFEEELIWDANGTQEINIRIKGAVIDITVTMLGCEAWTLTAANEEHLKLY